MCKSAYKIRNDFFGWSLCIVPIYIRNVEGVSTLCIDFGINMGYKRYSMATSYLRYINAKYIFIFVLSLFFSPISHSSSTYERAFEESFHPFLDITVDGEDIRLDAPYVSTPAPVVEKMVKMADIQPDDVVYDLGCGDGRFLIEAAKRHGVRAIGVDLDPRRVKEALENARYEGVEHLVTVTQGDIFDVNLRDADVVFLYLFTSLNTRLIPQLEEMKPGSRILAYEFPIRGVKPVLVDRSLDKYRDSTGSIFKWVLPFEYEKNIDWESDHIISNLDHFVPSLPIRFFGSNNTDRDIKIFDVIPDCRSCINLSASLDIVKPGERVEISGEVLLKARKGNQAGKINVLYELTIDELSYSIDYPLPYQLSQDSLVWRETRQPQVVVLKLSDKLNYKYSSYRLDDENFSVKVLQSDDHSVVFEVTPLTKLRTRSSLYIVLEPILSPSSEPSPTSTIPKEEIFVALVVEDVAK